MTQPTVFISYSHQDEQEKDLLLKHLSVLQGAGLIDVWSDDRIAGGADWEREIRETMARAKVAILLISVNFLTSDFILKKEVPELLERRKKEGLAVFPVIAQSCAWKTVTWLTEMNVRPKNGRPVWRDGGKYAHEDLTAIAEEVGEIIEKVSGTSPRSTNVLKLISSEAQAALDVCFEQSYAQIRHNLPEDIHSLAYIQLDVLKKAFLVHPLDMNAVESVVKSIKHMPLLQGQIRALLQEPTLQRLVRQSGFQQRYEKLVFGDDK